ncbi:GAF domain-containing protein [Streptomyces sp. NPDC055025]
MNAGMWDTLKRIGLFLLSGALAGGVFVLSIVADDASGAAKWRWTAVGTLVAFSVVAVAAYENRRAEMARQKTHRLAVKATTDLALAYNLVLVPTTERLRDLVASYAAGHPIPAGAGPSPAEDQYRTMILRSVLESAVVLTADPTASGLPRARSAYYERDPTTGDFNLKDRDGRMPPPRVKIPAVDMGGAHMNLLLTSGTSFRADGTPGKVSHLNPGGVEYKAVIAVPVRANGRMFGVLTVDAPEYEDFVPAHVDLMTTLGNVLAASLALGGP